MSSTVQGPNGMVIVTHVIPSNENGTAQVQFQNQNVNISHNQNQNNSLLPQCTFCRLPPPLKKFIKGEPATLGTTQIIIGILNILLGISQAASGTAFSVYTGVSFWGGLLFIISGSLSVAAEKHNSICLVKGSLGMNITSACATAFAITFYIIDIATGLYPGYYDWYYYCSDYSGHYTSGCLYLKQSLENMSYGVKSILLIFSVLEMCIAISLSAFGCKSVCCCNSSSVNHQPVVVVPANYPGNVGYVNQVNPQPLPPAYENHICTGKTEVHNPAV